MARTTKKKKTSSRAKPARAAAAKKRTKKRGSTGSPAGAKPARGAKRSGGKKETEVERHWREYQQCRAELETAVSAVREAEQTLSSARELERTRRDVFDRTKQALMGLLEVEPASASGSTPSLLDFSRSEFGDAEPKKPEKSSLK